MKKAVTLVTFVCLFTWLMPLGAFIRPSQEKVACDGCRAFHMCFGLVKIDPAGLTQKVSFTSASGFEKNHQPSSSGGGDDLLLTEPPHKILTKDSRFIFSTEIPHFFDFTLSLEPVPKINS